MKTFESYEPKIVLAVGAHADDIDFTASGSIAKWAAAGAEMHYLVITDGCKGTADTSLDGKELAKTRRAEQRAAAQEVGAKEVHFFDYEDGALEVTMALKKDIVRLIRQVRPDTVVVFDPTMIYVADLGMINHPDHRAAGQATLDAVYPLARDHLSFPDLYEQEKLEPHKVAHMLLINFERQNYYVDITNTFEKKCEALLQHVSQVGNKDGAIDMVRSLAEQCGQTAGCQYAEGFMRLDIEP